MNYFVTGTEGLLRGLFVQQLMSRQHYLYVLVRESSRDRFAALRARIPSLASLRIIPVYGDITAPNMGLSANDLELLKGNVDQFFHFTTVYDIDLDEPTQVKLNIVGTTNAIRVAQTIQAACFHHVSPLAGKQLFRETYSDDMVNETDEVAPPYFRSDQESEQVVRLHCNIPYRIHRPTVVPGVPRTTDIDGIHGIYDPAKTIH